MTLDEMRGLLDYHYWARDRLLAALDPLTPDQLTRDMENSFRSIHDTLVHIYGAEWVWWSRWRGESPARLPGEGFPDLAAVRVAWGELERQVRAFVEEAGEAGLARTCEYRLFNGTPGQSPLWQMVLHVVNHASYHRGQITTMLRQMGAAPPQSLDLIRFYRGARLT